MNHLHFDLIASAPCSRFAAAVSRIDTMLSHKWQRQASYSIRPTAPEGTITASTVYRIPAMRTVVPQGLHLDCTGAGRRRARSANRADGAAESHRANFKLPASAGLVPSSAHGTEEYLSYAPRDLVGTAMIGGSPIENHLCRLSLTSTRPSYGRGSLQTPDLHTCRRKRPGDRALDAVQELDAHALCWHRWVHSNVYIRLM